MRCNEYFHSVLSGLAAAFWQQSENLRYMMQYTAIFSSAVRNRYARDDYFRIFFVCVKKSVFYFNYCVIIGFLMRSRGGN